MNKIPNIISHFFAAAQIAKEVEKAEKTRAKEASSLTEASTSVCTYQHTFSPHWSPYISPIISWKKLFKLKHIDHLILFGVSMLFYF